MCHTSQIDNRTTLLNNEIQNSRRRILSLAEDAAKRTSLKQLTYQITLPLLPLLRKQIRLPLTPHDLGSSVILLASIAITYLLYYVTRRSLSITYIGSSSRLLDTRNSTAAGKKAPLLKQILQLHTLTMRYP
jgi:hypothetical protein